jgi:hypothetical protein
MGPAAPVVTILDATDTVADQSPPLWRQSAPRRHWRPLVDRRGPTVMYSFHCPLGLLYHLPRYRRHPGHGATRGDDLRRIFGEDHLQRRLPPPAQTPPSPGSSLPLHRILATSSAAAAAVKEASDVSAVGPLA